MESDRLRLRAPAKINVSLRILGKRPDGYHEIETIFLMVDLCDELEMERTAGGLHLSCSDPLLPTDERNLVSRAARLLAAEAGVRGGARLTLRKQVPVAAGLGGGSSDAAATLLGLNYLWRLGWPRRRLLDLAARLGADVPFFLSAACAIGTGTGATLEPLRLARTWPLLLITPGFQVSTTWAYGQVKLPLTSRAAAVRLTASHLLGAAVEKLGATAGNDLQPIVAAAYPEIGRILEAAHQCGAPWAFMSGSGPTVVAWFATPQAAERAARRLAGSWPVHLQRSLVDLAEVYPEVVLNAAAEGGSASLPATMPRKGVP
ncbi:MAG: 4-(cytidine 5'-diphospho)-2-C-methyl-D-erythritol kinase [Candidatus Tectomicrobia bacterium]|nr:4-(cytidine 5'-diphospho)-2-C-methyl-D-erythritol kinase [Candidatus Tectomicrobia bacterium]